MLLALCIIFGLLLQVAQRAVAYDYSQTVVLGDHEDEVFDLGVLDGGSRVSYHIEITNFEIHQGFPDRAYGGLFFISLEDWSQGEDCDSWSGALDYVFPHIEGELAETYTIPDPYPDWHWCMLVGGNPVDNDKKLSILVEYTIAEADHDQGTFLDGYELLIGILVVIAVIVIVFLLVRKGGEEIQN